MPSGAKKRKAARKKREKEVSDSSSISSNNPQGCFFFFFKEKRNEKREKRFLKGFHFLSTTTHHLPLCHSIIHPLTGLFLNLCLISYLNLSNWFLLISLVLIAFD